MASFMEEIPNTSDEISLDMQEDPTKAISIPESNDPREDNNNFSKLVEAIREDFHKAKRRRLYDEQRWLECYRNFRGIYGPSTQFTSTEKSKAFIKITKTKVLAAYSQVVDVLFAGNKFPIGIEHANYPVGVEESVSVNPNKAQGAGEQSQRNPQILPAIEEKLKSYGPKKKMLDQVKDQLEAGTSTEPNAIVFEPAKDAARAMEKKILDQLNEANASKSLRNTIFDMALFGSGCYKGPFATTKEYPRWSEDGSYNPIIKTIPHVEHVSVWDCYPDPHARSMDQCEKFIQRHKLSKKQLRDLKKRPHFRGKNIEALIKEGANYQLEYWENALEERTKEYLHDRWEVLEYWGFIDTEVAKQQGLKIPAEFKNQDQIQINAWVSGSYVLRLVLNPFTPMRIPYTLVPFELNPYSIFGVGVAENMFDTQLLMNGFMRIAVDNAAISSNVIFEVDDDKLVPGQSMEVFPGKIFRRQGGTPGQAVNVNKIENVTQETLLLFDKARQLADEATGMPSYAHGMTGVQNTNRTASGMSMLMSAAAQNIKTVVKNIDDYLLAPLGKALYAFNMQFDFKEDFVGDLSVVAKGTESLMRNEIRSQRLLQLAQFAAPNPAMAPFIKWDYILREYAASLDLDEDKVVNDPRAAQLQALVMNQVAQASGMMQQGQNPNDQGARGGVPNPSDPTGTGAGNIAPGSAPEPGAEGFTGNQDSGGDMT